MAIGDVFEVEGYPDCRYLDTGMYDTPEYGAVYLLRAERPAVIDTGIGTNYGRVLDALSAAGIDREELAVIAPTHVHLDHAGGAGFLARECPNAEVAVHRIGAPHLIDPSRLVEGTRRAVGDAWEFYTEPEPVPADRVCELEGGDRIDLGDRTLEVHHAPGHAPHQVAFHDPDAGAVFTGDAAGIYVPARDEVRPTTPPPNFDLERAIDDARALERLDPDLLCYAHFGPAEAGDRLAVYRDVLRDWVAAVERAREAVDDPDEIVDRLLARDDVDEVWGARRARGDAYVNVHGVLVYLDRTDG